jgi:hypothetical protein
VEGWPDTGPESIGAIEPVPFPGSSPADRMTTAIVIPVVVAARSPLTE